MEEATRSPDLLERAQAGEVAAFETFYVETVGGLLRWFRQRTAAGDVAADLCAETYSKALASLASYDATRAPAPTAWLYGIAKNELGMVYPGPEQILVIEPIESVESVETLGAETTAAAIRREAP